MKSRPKIAFFSMSAVLKILFSKRKQLRFSEINYLNYTKKDPILHATTTVSLKQGETRTSSGSIPHLLRGLTRRTLALIVERIIQIKRKKKKEKKKKKKKSNQTPSLTNRLYIP